MNSLASKISDSELEIMKYLWDAEKAVTITEIRKAMQTRSNWGYSTIKTLLRRLCKKGVVAAEKRTVFYYRPIVAKDEYKEFTTQSLINRLYSGSAKNLIASLIGNSTLSDQDINELRKMFKVGGSNE